VSKAAERGVRYKGPDLKRLGQAILEAVGTPEDLAAIVAGSLVDANLAGHDSHGVIRLTSYVAGVRNGQVQPGARGSGWSPSAAATTSGDWVNTSRT